MEDEVKTTPAEETTEPELEQDTAPEPEAEAQTEAAPEAEPEQEPEAEPEAEPDPLAEAQAALQKEHDQYLRLAAEYDNFRKRSQKEKDNIYRDAKADTTEKFLPVFDNLSRALEQETADTAYKKGVEMTMTGLMEILKKLDVTVYGEPGDTFSP